MLHDMLFHRFEREQKRKFWNRYGLPGYLEQKQTQTLFLQMITQIVSIFFLFFFSCFILLSGVYHIIFMLLLLLLLLLFMFQEVKQVATSYAIIAGIDFMYFSKIASLISYLHT